MSTSSIITKSEVAAIWTPDAQLQPRTAVNAEFVRQPAAVWAFSSPIVSASCTHVVSMTATGQCEGVTEEETGISASVLAGIILAVLASTASNLGVNVQVRAVCARFARCLHPYMRVPALVCALTPMGLPVHSCRNTRSSRKRCRCDLCPVAMLTDHWPLTPMLVCCVVVCAAAGMWCCAPASARAGSGRM